MKRLRLSITLFLGFVFFGILVHALFNNQEVAVSAQCPDCSGPEITDVVFESGMTCECTNADSLTIGSDVTVRKGASVTFKAPKLNVVPGARFEAGAVVSFMKPAAGTLTLKADPTSLSTGTASFSTITATLKDSQGNAVPQGTQVSFSTTLGTFPNGKKLWVDETYDATGTVVVYLYAGTTTGTATITAVSGDATGQVTVGITGSGLPDSLLLVPNPSEVPATGTNSSTLSATVLDDNDDPISYELIVQFTIEEGTGNLSAGSAKTVNGKATVTLSSGTQGEVRVKAAVSAYETVNSSATVSFTLGSLSLFTSQTSVKTDDSDSATITAHVLDYNNVPWKEVEVQFTTDGGKISASSVLTDADGKATVLFSSGTGNKSNRSVNITALVSGLTPLSIPIDILGSTVELSTEKTNLIPKDETSSSVTMPKSIDGNNLFAAQTDDPSTATLEITVKDAGGNGIYQAEVLVWVEQTENSGSATVDGKAIITKKTDLSGKTSVEVKGTKGGEEPVKILVKFNELPLLEEDASQDYMVNQVYSFGIQKPATEEDPYPWQLNKDLDFEVVAEEPSYESVIFATSLGTWDGTGSVVEKPIVDQKATAVLKGDAAGLATVQVYYKPLANTDPITYKDSMNVQFYLSSDDAENVILQSSSNVVALSTDTTSNSVTLQARVRSATGQIVPYVPVSFQLINTTGGGEYISPPIAYTRLKDGIAEATFISGAMSSGANGVEIEASIVDNSASDSARVVIGGTAASVQIGYGSSIESSFDGTLYQLPMVAQVVDSNGNAIPGAAISLKLWPKFYNKGIWVPELPLSNTICKPEYSDEGILNEDNFFCPGGAGYDDATLIQKTYCRDLILEPEEDENRDEEMTPSSSAAGSVPAQVVADSTGVASFYLTYPKSSAAWIEAEIIGTTFVLGSETQSTITFVLPWDSLIDSDLCVLPDSPYNNKPDVGLTVTATPEKLPPDNGNSTSLIRVYAFYYQKDDNGEVVPTGPVPDGTEINFAIQSGTGAFLAPSPTGLNEFASLTTSGWANVTYYSGNRPGEVKILTQLAGESVNAEQNLQLTNGPLNPYAITLKEQKIDFAGVDDDYYAIRATVLDDDGWPVVDNTVISFAIISGSGSFNNLQETFAGTNAGQASVSYIPADPTVSDTVIIKATAQNGAVSNPLLIFTTTTP